MRYDLDVFVYVKHVLNRLLAGETDYHSLQPDVWKEFHPEAVRVYRQEERAARADAKATKRARRRGPRKPEPRVSLHRANPPVAVRRFRSG